MNKGNKKISKVLSRILCLSLMVMMLISGNVFAADSTQSVTINNTTLTYSKIYYVNANTGNDTTGDGSENAPYATLTKASSIVNQDNVCIYVTGEGTYNATTLASLLKTNYQVSYVVKNGLEGKVILNLSATSSSAMTMTKMNSINGFIIKKYGADNRIYEYFADEATINLEFNNCVFDVIGIYPAEYPIFTGGSSGCRVINLNYNNCSFIPQFGLNQSDARIVQGKFTNCAAVKSGFIRQSYNLNAAIFDSSYNITSNGWKNTGTGTNPDGSQANLGVYGGQFAWGSTASSVNANGITLNKTTATLNMGQEDILVATVTPNDATDKTVTWTSSNSLVASVDVTGKVLAGRPGTATITATTNDGTNLTATCVITVVDPNPLLDLTSEQNIVNAGSEFVTYVSLHNVKDIFAEDIRINYNSTLFEFVRAEPAKAGYQIFRQNTAEVGKLKFIVANKGEENGITGEARVLKITFRAKNVQGIGRIEPFYGQIANGIDGTETIVKCVGTDVEVVFGDVNGTGDYTLADLAIAARKHGKDRASWDTSYNVDQVPNDVVDDDDLQKIVDNMRNE
ncbi:MAG: Ig-like domain-containing protein [Clostridiaceae bacterium]